MFRHSCGVCHYTNLHRPSDITLADFWGWEDNVPGMNDDDKGLSLMLLNTEKGMDIIEKIRDDLDLREIKVENCLRLNPNLQHPSIIHPKRKQFEKDYKKKGFEYVLMHDYNRPSMYMRVYLKLKKIVKKLLLK